MRKIPTVFAREYVTDGDGVVVSTVLTDEVTPGCEWVLAGEGEATRKYDGVAVMLDAGGAWWARRDVKPGQTAPAGFVPVQTDPVTGRAFGWVPMVSSPWVKHWRDAVDTLAVSGRLVGVDLEPGTFELVGPKINGNPEQAPHHRLHAHARAETWYRGDVPNDPAGLKAFVRSLGRLTDRWEGVVFHHPDGRMAKLKVKDV